MCCWSERCAKWFVIITSIIIIALGVAIILAFTISSVAQFVKISPFIINSLLGFGLGGGIAFIVWGVFAIIATWV